ncbi:SidE phosphodiesterase domain-containing protein [Legionella feeleii]|uniref:Poly(ADP-ribose) polymerase catalytic domain n=1 Tax=Legionella feeleii TaxID=453 RepID=A0A378IQK0_9GAMM|nr:SidE phosphodiesterase domain-containing protein [Legionella feeleii]STX36885.1 Poly(ADP-ribose) polymerase catalytic domain [Legionella feeleii]
MFTKTDSQPQGPETDIVNLPTKSSSFGYTMSIDLAPLNQFKKFWQHNANTNKSGIWQCLANNYINRPYLDIPSVIAKYSYNLQHDNYTVYHRNHDVTHAVRQRHYAQNYLEIIAKYGKDEFSTLAEAIINDAEVKTCLELAIFLCRSGRTNEQSGRDDPNNAKRSSELFTEVATRLGFDKGLIEFLAFSIATHKPDFAKYKDLVSKLPGNDKEKLAKLLYRIIDLSHHTDLVRCKTGGPDQPVRKDIEHELSELLAENKVNVPNAVSNLLTYAIQACKTTGTCVKYQEFGRENTDYDAQLKVLHTKDVLWSMGELQKVELDIEQEIHNGKYGAFQELIKKVTNTKKLDLTNWRIDTKELNTLLKIIEQHELTSAFLVGLKPSAHQQTLVTALQNKSKNQNTPILIKYAQALGENAVNNFDQQFQQQARDRLKVSMAFEPSRLARAKDNGISAYFSQMIKEAKGDVPAFGGDQFATHVTGVTKLANDEIEQKYAAVKKDIKLQKPLPQNYLAQMQTIEIPDIQLEDGEMLLYHGTGADIAHLIMTNGFDENRCRRVTGNGYGPLGKGIYFTSELSKAATFSRCSQCNMTEQCSCYDKETMQPAERVVLLNRVYVGNAEILSAKNDLIKEREKPADSFDSCIALSQELDPKSDYRSTEICVPKGAQIIPLYEIRFTFTPNYLLSANWDKALANNGLANVPSDSFQTLLKNHRALLAKVNELIDSDASNINAQIDQLQKLGHKIIYHLTKMRNQLGQIQHPDIQQEQSLKQLTIQLRDMNTLQTQLTDYLKQNIAEQKDQQLQEQEQKKPVISSYASFFTPKYVLKQKITTLNDDALNRDTFISGLIKSLDIALEYNQKKNHSSRFALSMFSSNPPHRTRLTQEMIRLRESLNKLDKNDLVQANKLLSEALDDLTQAADNHNNLSAIKTSTAYKNLLQHQQKLQQLMLNETVELADLQSAANNHSVDNGNELAFKME